MSNIVDVVVADKNLGTLLRGMKAAGLETELTKKGPFTVFAPTDLAFNKLSNSTVANLLKAKNKIQLTALLNSHVVTGKLSLKDLKNDQVLKTINGKELRVKISNGKLTINGAQVMGRENEASNGMVHLLDAVFLTSYIPEEYSYSDEEIN